MASLTSVFPHWEALTSETIEVFHLIASLDLVKRFYLAGGSGLALHLGHRFSVDLDFFSTELDSVGPDERTQFRKILNDPTLTITYDKNNTFVASWRSVGVSFFQLHQYPLIQLTILVDEVPLASLEEIGAMKLAAIIGRGTKKDLVDLYFILERTSLETLFQIASLKYPLVRTFAISATRALSYFDDADAQPMPRMLDRTPWSKMKRFLEHQAMEAGRQHLEDLWK